MGYYMTVTLQVYIDPISGQPSEYTETGLKPINLCNYVVPEEHRKYIRNRGWLFHEYVKLSREDSGYSLDATYLEASHLAECIPTWAEFKCRIPSDWVDEWTEARHNEFEAAMNWFGSKGYIVTWSY